MTKTVLTVYGGRSVLSGDPSPLTLRFPASLHPRRCDTP